MYNMLVTKEIDYSLRMLSALSAGEQMTMNDICDRELAPQQFGYKILKKLAKAGMVEITRGNGGGCRLKCDLKKITLFELMQVMGSDMHVSACMQPGYDCSRRRRNHNCCRIHNNLQDIQHVLDEELKKHTLADMIGI